MESNNKNRKKLSDEQRQLNRWVMDLGNYLVQEKNMDKREAMRKAHLTKNLLNALGKGVVRFTYSKQDGTVRTARGTLAHGVCAEYDAYCYVGHEVIDDCVDWPYSHFVYWDIDKRGFRSFRAEQLKEIN